MVHPWRCLFIGVMSSLACRPEPAVVEPAPAVVEPADPDASEPVASEPVASELAAASTPTAAPTQEQACDQVVSLRRAEQTAAGEAATDGDARRLHLMCAISFRTASTVVGAPELDAMIACTAKASSIDAVSQCTSTAYAKAGNATPAPEHAVCADFTNKALTMEESLRSGKRVVLPTFDDATPLEALLYGTGQAFAHDMDEVDLIAVFTDCVLLLADERNERPGSFDALSHCLIDAPTFSDLWACRAVR